MSSPPRVSVLMSVHNGEKYLPDAMDSVLRQTYEDFELIVFDDCSRDDSLRMLRDYENVDSRVHVMVNERNLGLTATLNRGLAMARGEYIARMDDDDISYPTRFERQVAFLEQNPAVAVVGTWAAVVNEALVQFYTFEPPASSDEIRHRLLLGNCMIHSSVMLRKHALAQVGGYNEAFRVAQDYDLWLRLSEKFEMANIPELLIKYRLHASQSSGKKIREQRESADRALALANARRGTGNVPSPDHPGSTYSNRLRGRPGTLGGDFLAWANQYLRMGQGAQAARLLGCALRESPLSRTGWRMAWRMLPDSTGRKKLLKDVAARVENRLRGDPPIPPRDLIYLVAAHRSAHSFLRGGRTASTAIREILGKNGIEVTQFGAILDFGCGVGRIMRHWSAVREPTWHGTDYNPRLVEWCKNNLKFAEFQVNPLSGRLPYESASFDFIYAFSVFTHLHESLQFHWISELSRVLKPAGYLYFTTHGEHYLSVLEEAEQERFRNGELVVREAEQSGSNMCATFHPASYVRGNIAKNLTLVDFIPSGAQGGSMHDVYLLQKPVCSSPS